MQKCAYLSSASIQWLAQIVVMRTRTPKAGASQGTILKIPRETESSRPAAASSSLMKRAKPAPDLPFFAWSELLTRTALHGASALFCHPCHRPRPACDLTLERQATLAPKGELAGSVHPRRWRPVSTSFNGLFTGPAGINRTVRPRSLTRDIYSLIFAAAAVVCKSFYQKYAHTRALSACSIL